MIRLLSLPPGPPPEWWRIWHPPAPEHGVGPTLAPLIAAAWEMWAAVAELEGDWPAARRAREQLALWRRVIGRGPAA